MSYPFLCAVSFMALGATAPAHAGSPAASLLVAVQAATSAPAAVPTRAALIENASKSFAELDTDKNGTLSKAEVDAAQTRAQQRAVAAIAQRVNDEFTKLDTDKSGQLSPAEFRAAAPTMRANSTASGAAMARLDANKDGKVTADEFRAPVLAAFNQIDTNKDGTISADERAKARR